MAIESEDEFDPGPLCQDDCIAAGECSGHTLYDLKRATSEDVPEVLAALMANVTLWQAISDPEGPACAGLRRLLAIERDMVKAVAKARDEAQAESAATRRALTDQLRKMADAPWGSPIAREAILACADRLTSEAAK